MAAELRQLTTCLSQTGIPESTDQLQWQKDNEADPMQTWHVDTAVQQVEAKDWGEPQAWDQTPQADHWPMPAAFQRYDYLHKDACLDSTFALVPAKSIQAVVGDFYKDDTLGVSKSKPPAWKEARIGSVPTRVNYRSSSTPVH